MSGAAGPTKLRLPAGHGVQQRVLQRCCRGGVTVGGLGLARGFV
jgi:hypothetical protein